MWKGKLAPMPPVEEYIADWRRRNLVADAASKAGFKNGSVSCETWGESIKNITLCKIEKGGHSWPGSCDWKNKIPGSGGACTMDVDAGEQAMAFFSRYMPSSTLV